VRGFLDLHNVEADFPQWRTYTDGWIARARRGPGISGGPEKTRTTYFYESGWQPYGSSWGAPFRPTETCDLFVPSPEPSPEPWPSFDPFASRARSIPSADPAMNSNGTATEGEAAFLSRAPGPRT